ncbi:2-succinyl-5-enolpyruvyl-6-hydroxy-3-cyclohexene-1-carboxylic-acid synthase [Bacillus tianshenii]|nr:2-succinyl-5-enolpyruvyl-6-hydroxy-3-cyclohexene-1-carboxylic-acid synthase [Bacillus tianshenii]
MSLNEPLSSYVFAFIDELVRTGVTSLVISPGSRSTPIAMAAAQHPRMETWVNIDERSAAFFALGMAKASKKPTAIVCTSGTAAANYMPAVVEAKQSRVPLIVLTADRPHELRDIGAPQAINQIDLFGSYVKWFSEMALPDNSSQIIRYVRTVAGRAAAVSNAEPAGPVHLNFPLREPLIPTLEQEMLTYTAREEQQPYVQVNTGKKTLSQPELEHYISYFEHVEKGLIVCGPQQDEHLPRAVVELAEALGWPILADPLSQLRGGSHSKELVIETYDAFLRDEEITTKLVPEVVIRFGAMPVSKAYMLFLKKYPHIRQMVVDNDSGWREPTLLASHMIYADPVSFCEQIIEVIDERPARFEWLNRWVKANDMAKGVINGFIYEEGFFEGHVVKYLMNALPQQASVFVGNSMPVRDLDTFLLNHSKDIETFANRGANGIDGVVSSALGVSTVKSPLVLLIGDLSFYHDLNGLLAAKMYQLNATIIVVNNDGGGIFSFLPQSKQAEHFESLFGTPHGLEFEYAVKMYGGKYTKATAWEHFNEALAESIEASGLHVIEVPTNRVDNEQLHRQLWKDVQQHISEALRHENS